MYHILPANDIFLMQRQKLKLIFTTYTSTGKLGIFLASLKQEITMDKALMDLGLDDNIRYYINRPRSFYIQRAIERDQGKLSKDGALIVETGKHTGRSAGDRYIVKSKTTEDSIWWENNLNPMTPENFEKLRQKVLKYFNSKPELYVTERCVGADEKHNINARTITTRPQHAVFTTHLFRDSLREFDNKKDFTILHAPGLLIRRDEFDTKSETCIVTCFDTNTTIIVGTFYAGEIKKSMFSVMNYRLPESNILPMHAGASKLKNNETSLFFGLSGTGKTTLSTDEGTYIIGDDEHGLSDEGVFNFEGGCYAKTYQLSKENEPEIWEATNRFGAMIENVTFEPKTGTIDFNDKELTENGRSSYPLTFIRDLEPSSRGQVPSHIFFLTADAFGVLPPVSKLTKEQAMFYFVLGYTAKLAGTEIGVKEPQATFSPCFGAPFMLRHPSVYAKLLGEYLDKHNINVWLVNTGWTGGSYGEGERFPLKITRQIIRQVQGNHLNQTETEKDPIFGLQIPLHIEGVENDMLWPQKTWKDQSAYAPVAKDLAASFHKQMENFGDFYQANIAGAPTFKS
ncbi:MAG: phosphoenolpyruvate carboxykinase (ATP) [Halobacteriovoraceae bacterium]|nr:phosphoenolpyruvate carboxykinase (ATP) [Halobacteriovoraceae bacterium]|tara:strand:- start:1127 stop:2833 length:1707 start_codon:yes stop_codon:yes gene_type:complete